VIRFPWRRKGQVVNPDGRGALIEDTGQLVGDKVLDLGNGLFINVADLAGFPETIPVHREEDR
jgi:hypothetical protein